MLSTYIAYIRPIVLLRRYKIYKINIIEGIYAYRVLFEEVKLCVYICLLPKSERLKMIWKRNASNRWIASMIWQLRQINGLPK